MADEIKHRKPIWKKWWFWLIIILVIIVISSNGGEKKKETTTGRQQEQQPAQEQAEPQTASRSPQQETKKYPSFTEETIDRNCVLSCAGGDEVVLWDKPTDGAGGARLHDKVPCGTRCWAFNKYYNEELNFTFYAVNTLDPKVKNAYGWVTDDLITWIQK